MQHPRTRSGSLCSSSRLFAVLTALFAACASEPAPSELPPDHPASPCADEAPPLPASTTLVTTGPEAPVAESAEASDAAKSIHHGDADDGAHGDGNPSSGDKAENLPQHYICPMHADVISSEPGRCPKCGMKLKKQESPPHHDGDSAHHDGSPR